MSPPWELKVRTFAGLVVNHHSAVTYGDGRYVFHLAAEESPAECVDTLPDGRVIKGHRVDESGVFDVLMSYCRHCNRARGHHFREPV